MRIRLGTQGWGYKDWVGPFYPPDTRPRDYLSVYARAFDAVELDTTFYATPRPAQVDAWRAATPDDFEFTAKTPRAITHDRHLVGAQDEMTEFLQAISRLREKLGAVLLQMPPDFVWDEREALWAFVRTLPSDVSFAVELRHRSWVRDETFERLREAGVAWTAADLHYMPRMVELTADFLYVRWLGERRRIERLHAVQIDRSAELDAWADKLNEVASRVQRIYGFANNHYSGHAPADIRYLRAALGLPNPEPGHQASLF
jgi:uncharacterized protein YecE (DUF72 family)